MAWAMVEETVTPDEIEYLVESLDLRDREKIFKEFEEEIAKTVSRTALMKLRRGEIHLSNYRIVELMSVNERAKEFVLDLARKKALRLLDIVKKVEAVKIPKEILDKLAEADEE